MDYAAEFRRCLTDLDAAGIMRIWGHVSPHLPQPENEAEALHALHIARTVSESMPPAAKAYSEAWLKERERRTIAAAVGITVIYPEHRRSRGEDMRDAMSEVVADAYKAGIDLDREAKEVKSRIIAVRDKFRRYG